MSKLVIVDDDPQMGRLLRLLFEMEGFQVTLAQRYQDILPTIQTERPDIVLMDVRVQGKETLDLVRQMRQEQNLAHIPVVMTSGMDYQNQCLAAGADCFVMKPFIPDEVVQMIGRLLTSAEK